MRIIGREVLVNFMRRHVDSRKWIECWIAETEKIEWCYPQDIKDSYSTVSFLSNNRVIFNVKGNSYRLVCKIAYNTKIVKVDWVGTHAEYSKKRFNRERHR